MSKEKAAMHPEIVECLSKFYYQDQFDVLNSIKGLWAREGFGESEDQQYYYFEPETSPKNLRLMRNLKSNSTSFPKFLISVKSAVSNDLFELRDVLSSFEDMLG